MQCVAIVDISGLGMHDQVMLVVYRILYIVSYFYNAFGNEDAAAIGIGGAYLFIRCCI